MVESLELWQRLGHASIRLARNRLGQHSARLALCQQSPSVTSAVGYEVIARPVISSYLFCNMVISSSPAAAFPSLSQRHLRGEDGKLEIGRTHAAATPDDDAAGATAAATAAATRFVIPPYQTRRPAS